MAVEDLMVVLEGQLSVWSDAGIVTDTAGRKSPASPVALS